MYECSSCMYNFMPEGGIRQKRASDPSIDGCESGIELSGSVEEQPVLLTTESSLQADGQLVLKGLAGTV